MTKNDLQLIRGVARAEFDSKQGIREKVQGDVKTGLTELRKLRKLYTEYHPNALLFEFIVAGKYFLDTKGRVFRVLGEFPEGMPDVATLDEFKKFANVNTFQAVCY